MPTVSDVRPTSHDRHDSLLVAALAAGDLSGTERDHATDLIETCADCATLHDDLVAIAAATASAPPPIAASRRDFRLTPEQAARLRPAGWRRLVGALAAPRLAFAKPLGIGLTTIGLAGLLIGNVPLSLGGSTAGRGAPAAAEAASDALAPVDRSVETYSGNGPGAGAFGPASSAAASSGPASPSAVAAPVTTDTSSAASAAPSSTKVAVAEPRPSAVQVPPSHDQIGGRSSSLDLRNLFFVAAILVGLGLLVIRRVARRVTIS
jgi:hypothetical protein